MYSQWISFESLLGLHLTPDLSCNSHIWNIPKDVVKMFVSLKLSRKNLSLSSRLSLCQFQNRPNIKYLCYIWAGSNYFSLSRHHIFQMYLHRFVNDDVFSNIYTNDTLLVSRNFISISIENVQKSYVPLFYQSKHYQLLITMSHTLFDIAFTSYCTGKRNISLRDVIFRNKIRGLYYLIKSQITKSLGLNFMYSTYPHHIHFLLSLFKYLQQLYTVTLSLVPILPCFLWIQLYK